MKYAKDMQTGAQWDPLDTYQEPHLKEWLAGKLRDQIAGALLAGMGDCEEDWEAAGCISYKNSRVLLYYTSEKVKSIFTSIWL